MTKYMDRHIATLFAMTDTKNPPKIEGFLRIIQLVFHDSEKWLDESEDESKYSCSPETIGTKSVDEIINQEYHQNIDHEWYKSESEPIERCCEHLQEDTDGCIHETENDSHDEGCHKAIDLNAWNYVSSSKNSYSR